MSRIDIFKQAAENRHKPTNSKVSTYIQNTKVKSKNVNFKYPEIIRGRYNNVDSYDGCNSFIYKISNSDLLKIPQASMVSNRKKSEINILHIGIDEWTKQKIQYLNPNFMKVILSKGWNSLILDMSCGSSKVEDELIEEVLKIKLLKIYIHIGYGEISLGNMDLFMKYADKIIYKFHEKYRWKNPNMDIINLFNDKNIKLIAELYDFDDYFKLINLCYNINGYIILGEKSIVNKHKLPMLIKGTCGYKIEDLDKNFNLYVKYNDDLNRTTVPMSDVLSIHMQGLHWNDAIIDSFDDEKIKELICDGWGGIAFFIESIHINKIEKLVDLFKLVKENNLICMVTTPGFVPLDVNIGGNKDSDELLTIFTNDKLVDIYSPQLFNSGKKLNEGIFNILKSKTITPSVDNLDFNNDFVNANGFILWQG